MLELILLSVAVAQPSGGADVGLILAVEGYRHRPAARYADEDADRFERLLVETVGVPPQRILRLDADRVGRGGLTEVVAAVSALASARPGGRLWLHAGGHGAMVVHDGRPITVLLGPRTPSAPATTKEILHHGVDLSALLDRLDQLDIRGGLAVIEACRGAEDPQLRPHRWPNPPPRRKISVWWAAQIGGPAFDLRDVRGGGLTHFVLRAFREARDAKAGLSAQQGRAFAWHGLRRRFAARGAWARPAPRLVAALEAPDVLFEAPARPRARGPE